MHKKYYILALISLLFALGCSRKKNTFTSRAFHNTGANYNGFFYAKEAIAKGEAKILASNDTDWEEILPLFIIPTEEQSKKVYPEMDRAIEKLSKVIALHSIKVQKKEYNRWVDDSYFLIGVSHFYKRNFKDAEKTLKFVSENFREEKQSDIRLGAYTWLALTYMEQDKMGNARNSLKAVDDKLIKKSPKEKREKFHAAFALYHFKLGNYPDAISEIELAIPSVVGKNNKAKYYYILGQLYESAANSKSAIENYQLAAKTTNKNEMRFYASIRQALAADLSVSLSEVKTLLNELLKEKKYDIYRDQIYWALADVAFKESEPDLAIDYLKKSVEVSQGNKRQKIKSFRKLADWHFDERKYPKASRYYDSTLVYLPKDNEEYTNLEVKSTTLKELVGHLNTVLHQDSIQKIAKLETGERDKFLMELVRRFEKEEEERRLQAELEAMIAASKSKSGGGFGGGNGAWYFYNNTTVDKGKSDFTRIWGDRADEDFWRVKSITPVSQNFLSENSSPEALSNDSIALTSSLSLPQSSSIVSPVQTIGRTPSYEELLGGLPTNDSLLDTSSAMIQHALYKSGILYKEYLDDFDYASEAFTEVVDRFTEGEYFLPAHYQLYRLFLKKESQGSYFTTNFKNTSAWYKDIILTDYPDTEYAYLILNPNAQEESERIRLAELEQYERLFKQYKQRNYLPTIREISGIIENEKHNHLIRKHYLLRALCIGYTAPTDALEDKLVEIVSLFPGTEEAETAQVLIAKINNKSAVPDVPIIEAAFKFNENEEQYFAVIIPEVEKDINGIKIKLSDFNLSYFRNKSLKISNNFINKTDQIILVKSFTNKTESMEYFDTFLANTDKVKQIKENGYKTFIISKSNYSSLFRNKDIDSYISFFNNNYTKK